MENLLSNLQTRALNGWATVTSFLRLLFIKAAVPMLTIAILLTLLLKVDQTEEIIYDVLGRLTVGKYWGGNYTQLGQTTYWAIYFATVLLAVVVYLSLLTLAKDYGESTLVWKPRLLAVANFAVLIVVSAVHFMMLQITCRMGGGLIGIPFIAITLSVLLIAICLQINRKRLAERLAIGLFIVQLVIIALLIWLTYGRAFYLFWAQVQILGP